MNVSGPSTKLTYCHPLDHHSLRQLEDGNLYDAGGNLVFRGDGGSYDFAVRSEEERDFHESLYATGGWWASDACLDAVMLDEAWEEEPGCTEYLRSIGDVRGKTVLLLGNGTSFKEFRFVQLGAHVVFTDLSMQGVLYIRRRYQASQLAREYPGACEFHAVNASYLPFAAESFDLIYADAMVHHLDDLQPFLSEIHRCLKPNGVCRFLDTAYSSAWQTAKKTVLHPLQVRTHLRTGISPEDERATARGGYTRRELERLQVQIGFSSLYYERVALLDYLLWRARCKLNLPRLLDFRPAIRAMDRLLARTPLMRRQGIALVFGFQK